MNIVGLDHVQLAMPAGEETAVRHFYGDILGLTEIPKPEPLRPSGGCWFVGGGAHIHVGIQSDFTPARKAHPALLVRDLPALRTHLAAHDIAIKTDSRLPDYLRFYVNYPFGNRVEFIQDGSGFSQA